MTYTSVDQVPSIYQWDPSSRLPLPDPGNAPANCGPTGVTFIANFYRDANFGINATRNLAGVANGIGTSIIQQREMLTKRGVSCYFLQPAAAAMREIVASGRRPMMVGLDMSKVSSTTRGHPFTGMHTVVLRKTRTVNGVRGFDVLDPNFSRITGRLDPTGGHRFYSEYQIDRAFVDPTLGGRSWALVPSTTKPIPSGSTTTRKSIHSELVVRGVPYVRSAPGGTIVGSARAGDVFVGRWYETAGPTYYDPWGKRNRRDWVGVERSGRIQWIAKAFLTTVRAL